MAASGYRIRMVRTVLDGPTEGRHRLGAPGLRHCRELRPVRARLACRRATRRAALRATVRMSPRPVNRPHRHVARASPAHLSAQFTGAMAATVVLATVLISGWYAATGAAAFAGMIAP